MIVPPFLCSFYTSRVGARDRGKKMARGQAASKGIDEVDMPRLPADIPCKRKAISHTSSSRNFNYARFSRMLLRISPSRNRYIKKASLFPAPDCNCRKFQLIFRARRSFAGHTWLRAGAFAFHSVGKCTAHRIISSRHTLHHVASGKRSPRYITLNDRYPFCEMRSSELC